MDVKKAYPPNYAAVIAAFPWVEQRRGIIFAWDTTIFNPDGINVTPSLAAHEEVHSLRQGGNPEAWWARYLTEPEFRYAEEVPAHIVEYAHIFKTHARGQRRLYLKDIAGRLAGPLYGNLTNLAVAMSLLKTGARVLLSPQPEGAPA